MAGEQYCWETPSKEGHVGSSCSCIKGCIVQFARKILKKLGTFSRIYMFAVNAENVHLIALSNTPFNRSDLGELFETVEWIQGNDYPTQGTYE